MWELSAGVLWSWPALLALGLCVGSFLNVVAHRLPLMMERQWWHEAAHHLSDETAWTRLGTGKAYPAELTSGTTTVLSSLEALSPLGLAKPRSRCPSCGHVLKWHENLPVVGWLRLGGKCSACQARISARYPLVEAGTGAVFVALGQTMPAGWGVLMWCAVAAALLASALIDWDTTLLPDSLTLPLLWGGLLASALGWNLPLAQALWGVVAGYLSLWSVYWLFKLTTGKEGMGYGDFKLLAALGAWLGPTAILPIVLMASVIGAAVGIALKFTGGLREGRYVPFGPFLAGGGMVVILTGTPTVLGWIGWS